MNQPSPWARPDPGSPQQWPASEPPPSPWSAPAGPGAGPGSFQQPLPGTAPAHLPAQPPTPPLPFQANASDQTSGSFLGQQVQPAEQTGPSRAAHRPPRWWWSAIVVATTLSVLAGGIAGFGAAQLLDRGSSSVPQAALPPTGEDTVAVAERLLESTVTIAYRSNTTGGTGSGFVLDEQGHIVTNNHVIEGAAKGETQLMVEFTDGQRVPARLIGRSPSYDLAVIKVERTDLKPVQLGDSASVRPGQGVLAVGAPLGLGGSITAGIVSAVDRPFGVGDDATSDDAVRTYINGIQTDASINPGNSGGPLADANGRVIGVNSAILTLGGSANGSRSGNIGLGFAIPMDQAKIIADEILRDGHATYPVIGAAVSPNADGVRLSDVTAGGPAAAAGLRSGDIVLAVEDKPVDTPTDLIVRIRSHRPGESISLMIRDRGPVTVTLDAKVG